MSQIRQSTIDIDNRCSVAAVALIVVRVLVLRGHAHLSVGAGHWLAVELGRGQRLVLRMGAELEVLVLLLKMI